MPRWFSAPHLVEFRFTWHSPTQLAGSRIFGVAGELEEIPRCAVTESLAKTRHASPPAHIRGPDVVRLDQGLNPVQYGPRPTSAHLRADRFRPNSDQAEGHRYHAAASLGGIARASDATGRCGGGNTQRATCGAPPAAEAISRAK